MPEPAEAAGDPGATTASLKAAITSHGIALDYVAELDGALGTSSGGRIQVPTGLQPASEFMVLAHEYAHELLHRSDDRPASRDTRELEAETVAFVVGQVIGLDATDAARDYIYLYRGDSAALAESLSRIQRTAAAILTAVGDDTATGREPFGDAFKKAVSNRSGPQQLDFGIAAAHGCFELDHEKKELKTYPAERALSAFLIRFLARLQALGTVPAIDYDVYGRLLE